MLPAGRQNTCRMSGVPIETRPSGCGAHHISGERRYARPRESYVNRTVTLPFLVYLEMLRVPTAHSSSSGHAAASSQQGVNSEPFLQKNSRISVRLTGRNTDSRVRKVERIGLRSASRASCKEEKAVLQHPAPPGDPWTYHTLTLSHSSGTPL